MRATRNSIHKAVHIFCMSGTGMFLPLSEYLTSVFIILLSANWLVGLDPPTVIKRIKASRYHLVFLLSFIVYLIWIINSTNTDAALSALRLKLPLLALSVIVITTPIESVFARKLIYTSFLTGVLIATVSGYIFWITNFTGLESSRSMSIFISHIRLTLMVVMAVITSYFLLKNEDNRLVRLLLIITGVWNIVFLILLFSFSAIAISVVLAGFILVRSIIRIKLWWIRLSLAALILILCLVLPLAVRSEVVKLFAAKEKVEIDYELVTLSGKSYKHYPERQEMENGYYVWRYICYDELKEQWNRLGTLDFDGTDRRGQKLEYTLIRYLTSTGLKKDSAGVANLNISDVRLIENGYANNIYKSQGGVRIKIYELFWQVFYYNNGGNPQGHSVTQRFEFMKTTFRLFRRFPLFGTGTGDFKSQLLKQYQIDGSKLDPRFRRSSHNQYLLIVATFGLTGASLFWFGIFAPIILKRGFRSLLFTIFFITIAVSMLSEDTLETHTGISFFAFFYFTSLYYPLKEKRNVGI